MIKIFTILLIPFILFGFDINFNKKFEKQIAPDKLSTHITVTVVKDVESEITKELDSFNKLISRNDDIEKRAGEFSVRPKYRYHKGESTLIGYNGTLRYTILSDNSKDMNKFIKSLLSLKDDEEISVSVSSLNWIISNSKKSELTEVLRLQSIKWAKKYARDISKELNNNCIIKNIHISPRGINPIYRNSRSNVMMLSSAKQESNIPVPQANKNSISINPHYILECK